MAWIYQLTNFLIGTCLASHACVVCDRFDTGDFIWGRSRCDFCLTKLTLVDELPILSYCFLHGKCRYCQRSIPIKLPLIEFLGGLAYLKIDFSQITGIATAIVIFCLLLAAICDYDRLEFHLAMIFPALLLALLRFKHLFKLQLGDLIELIPILLVLLFYTMQKKLGSGDLIIYLILAFFFTPHFANLVFLLGSFLLLFQFFLKRKTWSLQKQIAFVPYIFVGLIIQLLLQ